LRAVSCAQIKKPKHHDLSAKIFKNTEKRCVGGYGLRECAAQRQKTLAFSFNMSGDRCRQAREQDVERSTCPPTQRWSHSKGKSATK
jgi:hypothetical protein